MLQDWQNLSCSLVLDNDLPMEIITIEQFNYFEKKFKINFPEEYKEFCQIFGTGLFQSTFSIYAPSDYLLSHQNLISLVIKNISQFPSNNPQEDERKIDLLSHSFIFGCDGGSYMFIWDLNTYCDVDKSYDMYWVLWDSPSDLFDQEFKFLGRSFFDFIKNILLTPKIYEFYGMDNNFDSEKCCFERYIPRLLS
jgi:SMI1-KNR4 cell-wall